MEKAYMTDKVGCSLLDEMKQLHPEFTYCFTDMTKPPPALDVALRDVLATKLV